MAKFKVAATTDATVTMWMIVEASSVEDACEKVREGKGRCIERDVEATGELDVQESDCERLD